MFNFLKSLFQKSPSPSFGMGALQSPADSRNVALSSIQQPVSIPDEFETALPPVENQGAKGMCVGEAIHKIAELELTPAGQPWLDLSPDDLYEQCKLIDGIPNQEGTYPSVGAKIVCGTGIATTEAYKSKDPAKIAASRAQNKLSGYAFVSADFNAICQAIFQNKAIVASFDVDTNWFIGKIMKVLKAIGRHIIVLKGFKVSAQTLRAQNSWGIAWIGYIAGIVNPSVKAGCLELKWSDVSGTIDDLIVFTYIPPEVLKKVKNTDYRFITTMQLGMTSYEIQKLQERLGVKPTSGYFGNLTKAAVLAYQKANGIPTTGIVGPLTRASLNKTASQLVDIIIQIESGGDDNAIGDDGHAFGCLQIWQGNVDQVNEKLGTSYVAKDCLGNRELSLLIWNTYFELHPELVTDEDKARAWNGGAGWKEIYSRTNKTPRELKYCENIDAYWSKVQRLIG